MLRIEPAAGDKEPCRLLPLRPGIRPVIPDRSDPLANGRLFFQQLPESVITGIRQTALLHDPILEAVVDRQQAHAQMVGHKAANQLKRCFLPSLRREIQRLVIAIAAFCA